MGWTIVVWNKLSLVIAMVSCILYVGVHVNCNEVLYLNGVESCVGEISHKKGWRLLSSSGSYKN